MLTSSYYRERSIKKKASEQCARPYCFKWVNMAKKKQINDFSFPEGKRVGGKYEIVSQLGSGWEGEVYKIKEEATGIIRAAKFFYPQRNLNNKIARMYAKKLHKLRSCPIMIQYITQERIQFKGEKVTCLISDYVDGVTLKEFINSKKKKSLHPFQAVFFLHSLVLGLEQMHAQKEYHGDLHTENIMVQRYGLGFDIKVLDMFHYGSARSADFRDDLYDAIRVFYDIMGGKKNYAKLPDEVKYICCGLKKTLIRQRFRSVSHLRVHLENIEWS
jgi:serine/threonine protein kinase